MLNAYIHKPSFLKGIEVGRALKRLPRVIEEPVEPDIPSTPTQYLYGQVAEATVSYNGVVLPDIESVWTDKQTYPYACMRVVEPAVLGTEGEFYMLWLCTDVFQFDGTNFITAGVMNLYGGVSTQSDADAFGIELGVWTLSDENMTHGSIGTGAVHWTSHDILNTDGSVYLAASDPVKSYPDATVIVDGVGYKGAILPALPEWDREQYPYAILKETVTDFGVGDVSRSLLLHCYAANAYYFTSNNRVYFGGSRDVEPVAAKMYRLTDDTWVLDSEYDNNHIQVTTPEGDTNYGTTVTTFWANFKAEYDGTVYIDPSDPIPVGEPIAYSYNGVTLPALSESDLEYAVIIYSGLDVTYFLNMFDEQPIAHNVYYEYYDTTQLHIGRPEGCRVQFWGSSRDGWDKQTKPTTDRDNDNGWAMANSDRVHWTSHDILNEDGTIYLSASDPVPVYE